MIAAALAHVALTKCKWRHPSNCRQKGSRSQLSGRRLQDRLKPNYPFVSSGRSINPHACKRAARGKTSREWVRSRFLTRLRSRLFCNAMRETGENDLSSNCSEIRDATRELRYFFFFQKQRDIFLANSQVQKYQRITRWSLCAIELPWQYR